ncbi:MAG: hypothetical protein WCS15_00235 [Prevotella sp.]
MKWYTNRAVWAVLITAIGALAGAFGYEMSSDEQDTLTNAITAIASALAGISGVAGTVYWRVKSKSKTNTEDEK